MIWGGDYVAAASFKPGNTVYWTETGNTIRSGVIVRRTGNRYIIRAGYEAGVCLPAARLYATYEDAAATLPRLKTIILAKAAGTGISSSPSR